ncbi:Nucleotide-binding universal stress protein, UspA family [Maribacter dokdonensis]|uniref:Nucleotide-binding universal stress protein, UspA family n=1 Tax=Maribacter dokdonensis TaxID=320912 RepID=A0A1H4PTY9_9FLAO|nr:universal stress protein [Maribacter dokdonensis]SEC10734.1 Nucleotide-binding universal stress protein, UspA family [Maribacter dokdonensis]
MESSILIPTDFSKNSWNAMLYAIKLFEDRKCSFYILHAYAKETYGLDSLSLLDPDEAFNKTSENNSKKGLRETIARLHSLNKNTKHSFYAVSESMLLLSAVKNLNKKIQFDLLVLGAKGSANKNEAAYGQHTLEILKNVKENPILIVPGNVDFNQPKEIVLTTNFNTNIKKSEIEYLVTIAKLSNASIQVLSLEQPSNLSFGQKRNKVKLRNQLKDVAHSFNTLRNVKMAIALNCFVAIRHSNMISYVDKKPSFWERFSFGRLSLNNLGYYAEVPVLAIHSK